MSLVFVSLTWIEIVTGDTISFVTRGQAIVAKVLKVAQKNLKAIELEVNGNKPVVPRRWTVAPEFCTRVDVG